MPYYNDTLNTERLTKTMRLNFDKKVIVADFEVGVDTSKQYGYFEWTGGTNEDSEISGGLWFENNNLIDYDGTFNLPIPVKTALIAMGFTVDEDF